jgi:predicted nucleotidyltransferase component of viral defense system
MIDKRIVDFISQKEKIFERDLIEKDLILTLILKSLSNEKDFFENYAFKGGTCLIKFYLGYFRFSEDLDFTYLRQELFDRKSSKESRRIISKEVDRVAGLLEKISEKNKLRFKADKKNKEYFEFGGGNKFTTFKIWYNSSELGRESFIKIQINYIEKIQFDVEELKSMKIISENFEKEFSINFPEAEFFLKPVKIKCYDIKEILCEKVRAILTRRGIKARDFIDIFMIEKKARIKPEDFERQILEKIRISLDNEKYLKNLNEKEIKYSKGEEERLLLLEMEKGFYKPFLERLSSFLIRIRDETNENTNAQL